MLGEFFERSYLGNLTSLELNGYYAAALFEGKVELHTVCYCYNYMHSTCLILHGYTELPKFRSVIISPTSFSVHHQHFWKWSLAATVAVIHLSKTYRYTVKRASALITHACQTCVHCMHCILYG